MKPLIFDFIEKRTDSEIEKIFYYDHLQQLNVVKQKEKTIPFINLSVEQTEMTTKTKRQREEDDQHWLVEMQTKTERKRERDDRPQNTLELMTKTFTKRESDDK